MQSIITDSTITLIAETGPSVIGKSHPNFYKNQEKRYSQKISSKLKKCLMSKMDTRNFLMD